MKRFKKFLEEEEIEIDEASAADLVGDDDSDEEATEYEPRSKGEKKFKDKHKVATKEHPTADPSVHKGSTKKTTPEGTKKGEKKVVNPIKESIEELNEDVIDTLKKIVKNKQAQSVKFEDGKSTKVDLFTASALIAVYDKVNKQNQEKIKRMANKSSAQFMQVVDVAWKLVK